MLIKGVLVWIYMIEQYDKYLYDLLNKHAPRKNIYMW